MRDIEDLGDEPCSHYVAPPKKGTPAARLHNLSGMINQRRVGRLGTHGEDCFTCVAKCDTAAESGAEENQTEEALEARWSKFPIINPYGDSLDFADLVTLRAADPSSDVNAVPGVTDHDQAALKGMRDFFTGAEAAVRETGHLPDVYKAAMGAGSSTGDPRTQGRSASDSEIESDPHWEPLCDQMVKNVQHPDTAPIHDDRYYTRNLSAIPWRPRVSLTDCLCLQIRRCSTATRHTRTRSVTPPKRRSSSRRAR